MNCYLIASPFQLISALEASNSSFFNNCENMYIIFYGPNRKNNHLLKEMISIYNVQGKIVSIIYKNQFQFLISKLRLLKKIINIKFSNLFIGHFDEFSNRVFLCNLSYNKLFNLDDGAFSLVLNNRLDKPLLEINLNESKTFAGFVKLFLLSLYGLKWRKKIYLNWFTMFDFSPNNTQEIVNHKFEYLKSKHPIVPNDYSNETCYFIGSNLLNVGIFKDDISYLKFLEQVLSSITSREIIYIPHRLEDVSKIISILNKYNIKIEYPENVIELFFLIKGIYPTQIISFYSTALYSISKIYPDTEIFYIEIPADLLSDKYFLSVSAVQQKYKEKFKLYSYV